jgi:hypothetical protein
VVLLEARGLSLLAVSSSPSCRQHVPSSLLLETETFLTGKSSGGHKAKRRKEEKNIAFILFMFVAQMLCSDKVETVTVTPSGAAELILLEYKTAVDNRETRDSFLVNCADWYRYFSFYCHGGSELFDYK